MSVVCLRPPPSSLFPSPPLASVPSISTPPTLEASNQVFFFLPNPQVAFQTQIHPFIALSSPCLSTNLSPTSRHFRCWLPGTMSRSSYSYSDSDEDYNIHVRQRGPSTGGVRYVSGGQRPQSYYDAPAGPSRLGPDRLTTVITRSKSRERSRSRDRRTSSPPLPAPVIINNRIYNDISSDDDDDDHRKQVVRRSSRRRRSRSHSRSRSGSSSYVAQKEWEVERARKELEDMRLASAREKDEQRLVKGYREEWEAEQSRKELEKIRLASARQRDEQQLIKGHREEWEAERSRKELERMRLASEQEKDKQQLVKGYREEWEAEQSRKNLEKVQLANARDDEERRILKKYREEEELKQSRRELDAMKEREAREAEEERIMKAIDLKRLRAKDAAKAESDRREKEANAAVEEYKRKELERVTNEKKLKDQKEREAAEAIERYKREEKERIAKEKAEKEAKEKEYQKRLREDLVKSGLDDEAIDAIMKKEKIKKESSPQPNYRPLPHHGMAPNMGQISHVPHTGLVRPMGQPNHVVHTNQAAPMAVVQNPRPTYTRMARRHLSIESLRAYGVEFDLDDVCITCPSQFMPDLVLTFSQGSRVCLDQTLGARVGTRSVVEAHQVHPPETRQDADDRREEAW